MIISFGSKETETLWKTGNARRLSRDVARKALIKLQTLHVAENIERMGIPPANRLKKLSGSLRNYWSVRINDQWRLIFRYEDGDALDVQIIDYH